MSTRKTPSEYLKQIIGRPVVVKLNSGVDYRGEDCVQNICDADWVLKFKFKFKN